MELTQRCILCGPNGVGKSNIVDSVRFLKDALDFDLDRAVSERHGIDSIRQWSPSKPYDVTIRLEVKTRKGESGNYSLTLASSRGYYHVKREEAEWNFIEQSPEFKHADVKSARLIRTQGNDDCLSAIDRDGNIEKEPLDTLDRDDLALNAFRHYWGPVGSGIRKLHTNIRGFDAYSIFPNTLRTPQKPSNERRLNPSGDNLASIFREMTKRKKRAYQSARNEILTSLQEIMPSLENIHINNLQGHILPSFWVREKDQREHAFNVGQISDGTLRVLGLLCALYQPEKPNVIALEEPEQTINPGILHIITDAVKEVSDSSQVLITTHSPNLIDLFDAEDIFAVTMNKGATDAGPIAENQKQAVRDRLFTIGELMSVEGLYTDE